MMRLAGVDPRPQLRAVVVLPHLALVLQLSQSTASRYSDLAQQILDDELDEDPSLSPLFNLHFTQDAGGRGV